MVGASKMTGTRPRRKRIGLGETFGFDTYHRIELYTPTTARAVPAKNARRPDRQRPGVQRTLERTGGLQHPEQLQHADDSHHNVHV